MTKNPGFFATFFSLCCGTEKTPQLVRNPFGKVLLQFLLLCVLISLCVAAGQYGRIRQWIEDSETSFTGAFGPKIVLRGNNVYPGTEETKARSIVLPYKGRLCYTGNANAGNVVSDLGGLRYFILWRDGKFSAVVRVLNDEWDVLRPGEKTMKTTVSGDRAALALLLQESEPHPKAVDPETQHFSVAAIADSFRVACFIVTFLQQLIVAFVLGIFSSGVAALVFSIGSRRLLRGVNLWKSALYAGFPAAAIAGCFPMLDLPFLTYSQVYLCAAFFYWIAVVLRIEITWRQETPTDSKGDSYDN